MSLFLYFFLSLSTVFASPTSQIASILAYFLGYPCLILFTYKFDKKLHRGFVLYLFGLCYFLYQMRWMGLAKYQGSMIVVGYLILSVLFSINYFFLGYLLPKRIKDLCFDKIVLLALMFTFFEYTRLWVLSGFPFHQVGLIFTANLYTLQLASIVGVYGLSFIVISISLFAAKNIYMKNFTNLSAALFSPIALGMAMYHFPDVEAKINSDRINVGIVQTGMLVEEKWMLKGMEAKAIDPHDQIMNLFKKIQKVQTSDLIVIPESCLPDDVNWMAYQISKLKASFPKDFFSDMIKRSKCSTMDVLSRISKYYNNDIVFGGIEGRYTTAFYLSNGELIGRYNKRRLVPFGEYLPFQFLKGLYGDFGGEPLIRAGNGTSPFFAKWTILPSVCFDEGYPEDFLQYKPYNPMLHVNISNDAWFVFSNLVDAHFLLGKVRSLENGLYTIRACNTGISCLISPKGEVIAKMDESLDGKTINSGTLAVSFQISKKQTLFSYIGNKGYFFIVGILTVLHFLYAKREALLRRV